MRFLFTMVCLLLPGFLGLAGCVQRGVVNLVPPIAAPAAVDAVEGEDDEPACENGLVLQENGRCCPPGTNNSLWPDVCTPIGAMEGQLFNLGEIPHYCPRADMFIVSDKNWNWFSCADRNSRPLNTGPTGTDLSRFCMEHGYGYLLKIDPWGTVGCVRVGESQGDGCIEAGTCSFGGR